MPSRRRLDVVWNYKQGDMNHDVHLRRLEAYFQSYTLSRVNCFGGSSSSSALGFITEICQGCCHDQAPGISNHLAKSIVHVYNAERDICVKTFPLIVMLSILDKQGLDEILYGLLALV